MKFSFSLERNKRSQLEPITGRAIQSSVVQPNHAELLRAVDGRIKRMYDAAITTNLDSDFGVSTTSANAEILVSVAAARSRARKQERDNPYAWAMLASMQNNVGGHDPFRLEMKVGKWSADGNTFIEEKETNRKIEESWKQAGLPENCTASRNMSRMELDLQAITAMVRDGGILARHRRGFSKNKFFYAIKPLEVDRLDYSFNRPGIGSNNKIQFSIEVDEDDGPVAYWLLTQHPGDTYMSWSDGKRYREQVPAEDIIALWDIRTRAGQYIGMPRFSSIIKRLHRMDQFDIAHVTAAIWASCKPFFLTRDVPTAGDYNADKTNHQGEKISSVEPATGEILPDGYKPYLVDPKFPIESSEGFKKEHLRAASAGSGTPYHVIANDLEGVNFSSGRMGLDAYHDECKKLQSHFILNYRRPHFNEWLKYALMSGALDLPFSRYEEFVNAAVFHGRRWPYVNPLQDAQADILRINAGLTSRDIVIAESENGGDVESVNASIANGRKSDKAHKLDFTNNDPTKPGEMDDDASKTGGKQTIK